MAHAPTASANTMEEARVERSGCELCRATALSSLEISLFIDLPHFARMAVASLTPAWPADCCFHLTSIVRITHVCSFDANDCEIFAMHKVRRLEMVVRAADLGGFAA